MIKTWRLKNFKSIGESMEAIHFGKLTILAGANSSGKSSVIQSILLLMQTLAGKSQSALQLNGELVSLGTVGDLWHDGKIDEPLSFEFSLDNPKQPHTDIHFNLNFLPIASDDYTGTLVGLVDGNYIEKDVTAPRYFEYLHVKYNGPKVFDHEQYIVEELSENVQANAELQLADSGLTQISAIKGAKIDLQQFLPGRITFSATRTKTALDWETFLADPLEHKMRRDQLRATLQDDYMQKIETAIQVLELPALHDVNATSHKTTLVQYRDWYGRLSAVQAQALKEHYQQHLEGLLVDVIQEHTLDFTEQFSDTAIEFFNRKIRYLSANRIAPTALFNRLESKSWSEVNTNGSNVAAALIEFGAKTIRFWHPVDQEVVHDTLMTAVMLWLKYFELVEDIKTRDYGKLGTFLSVKSFNVDRDIDLTSVGFGISQILPIIVQGLLTPINGMFIVEQPEVHLHPQVQSQLAIFFLALTQAGVQCLVETHSEHIVDQLRLLIAQRKQDTQAKLRMYFVSRLPKEGSVFEKVEVSKAGNITNWPEGFMNQSKKASEQLLFAMMNQD